MLVGEFKEKRSLGRQGIDRRIILNMLGCGLYSSGSVHGTVAGCLEHDNESSGPIKGAKFLQLLSEYQLLKDICCMEFADWNSYRLLSQ
jgi:hypothetical protein